MCSCTGSSIEGYTQHSSRQGEPVSKNALYHHVPSSGRDLKIAQAGEQVTRERGLPDIRNIDWVVFTNISAIHFYGLQTTL